MDRVDSDINGSVQQLAAERAAVELRRGRVVDIYHEGSVRRVAAVETANEPLFAQLEASSPSGLTLLLSPYRAQYLDMAVTTGVEVAVPGRLTLANVRALAGLGGPGAQNQPLTQAIQTAAVDLSIDAALQLTTSVRLIPALICAQVVNGTIAGVLQVDADAIVRYQAELGNRVERVSQARVPLRDQVDSEIVLYREVGSDAEHVAVLIGEPSPEHEALVRLHSSCLTGDLLGSLRCDCGEQLRDAVAQIAANGGGVLLYLAQEGRGIGLANKLRAYVLQEAGFDTIDADRHLGFSADERRFSAAAAILKDLGLTKIRLLTNNPQKVVALLDEGIELGGQIPLRVPANPHNARYLKVKRERAGHL